ncbi:MAG: magnesium-translocating P-type ATPase [Blastocatellia bacterium]
MKSSPAPPLPETFWTMDNAAVLAALDSHPEGLGATEAARRLALYGRNTLKARADRGAAGLLLAQFKSPLIIILMLAAALSLFPGESPDAAIIIGIVLLSGLLGFWQEYRAATAVEKLLSIVRVTATVPRDNVAAEIHVEEVVPGDVVLLSAGNVVPGDCLLLTAKDLYVDEAALTGESFPAEKRPGAVAAETPLAGRANALWMGTHVISGQARAVIVRTGAATEFGRISERLRLKPAETEFEHGVRRFGYLLTEITFALVLVLFGASVIFRRPVVDSFLFAVALAVGMIPELLPAIISVNLAIGAERMARRRVIVKQLTAIENFGAMDVLCSDNTGTLTEGAVHLHAALDAGGVDSEKAQLYGFLNAAFETGFSNPIDEAIRQARAFDTSAYRKLDEAPYDFIRKRLSILVETKGQAEIITKGALRNVLDVCATVEIANEFTDIAGWRERIEQRAAALSAQGFRTLGVACRAAGNARRLAREDEHDLTFLGLLVFADPPKAGIAETIGQLRDLGVRLKVITGDNRMVAAHVATQVFGAAPRMLTGPELHHLGDDALRQRAPDIDVFAEVEPHQKERIILALRKAGHVTGYLGDGINDAAALHAADAGISVNNAVDVAREAAAIVLLDKDLSVLLAGVREGRATFANTIKYIFMTTSANFGNMFSMAGAALFLPFLPLLPKQILLNNFLSDFPAMAIATDSVDEEWIARPRRWDMRFIRDFMLAFGAISSVFDFLTFGALLWLLDATPEQFRTGWFLESVITELLIVIVIRTSRPFYKSRMGRPLFYATLLVLILTLALPYLPINHWLGLTPLPPVYLLVFGVITALYLLASEMAKKFIWRRAAFDREDGNR